VCQTAFVSDEGDQENTDELKHFLKGSVYGRPNNFYNDGQAAYKLVHNSEEDLA
jgi:hypothetical protein